MDAALFVCNAFTDKIKENRKRTYTHNFKTKQTKHSSRIPNGSSSSSNDHLTFGHVSKVKMGSREEERERVFYFGVH